MKKMDVNNLRQKVSTQQRLRDESRNWAVISFLVTAIVWSFTSDLVWRGSVTVVAAILLADYIFFRNVDSSSPSVVPNRNSAALTFGARKPQSRTIERTSDDSSANDDLNPPKTLASINSSTKTPIAPLVNSDITGRNEILSYSSMAASWKEIKLLQQQQQQQQQQQPDLTQQHYHHHQYPSSQRGFSLDPSYTNFLSPSPATNRGHPVSAATPPAMNASYSSNISGGAYPMAYTSPFPARGLGHHPPPATTEWQEYRLSPSVSFRGDRPVYDAHHRHPNLNSTGGPMDHPTTVPRSSHDDLRAVSVQNALGIERDVPDEWVEALKELVGKHLRTQLKIFDESSRVILESLRTVIKPAAGSAAPSAYPVNPANTISQGDFTQAAALVEMREERVTLDDNSSVSISDLLQFCAKIGIRQEVLLDYEYARSLFFLSDMIYASRTDDGDSTTNSSSDVGNIRDAVKMQKRLRDMAAKSSRLRFVIARHNLKHSFSPEPESYYHHDAIITDTDIAMLLFMHMYSKAALLRGNFNSVFHAASTHNAPMPGCYVTIRRFINLHFRNTVSDIEHSLGNSQQTPTGKSSETLSQRFLIFRDFASSRSHVPTYNSPEHKFVVLHLVEAQSANLTQRKVRQAEVVEVEEGSNNVFECMVVFLLLTLIFIEDVDHISNKYLDDGGRLSSRMARDMLKDIFGTKEINQCINDTLGLNL